jgi:hypothetical protein
MKNKAKLVYFLLLLEELLRPHPQQQQLQQLQPYDINIRFKLLYETG